MIMDELTADGLISEVLYPFEGGFDFRDPEEPDRFAQSMIDRRYFPAGVENYAEAISRTVRAGRLPAYSREVGAARYSEQDRFEFLRKVDRRLEELKPWPRPPFVKIPVRQWEDLGVSQAVARIDRPMHRFEAIFNQGFDRVAVGDGTLPVILLELRTGEIVAVIGSVEPGSTVFTLMRRGDDDPATVIAHFGAVTGIPAEQIEAL